MSFGTYFGCCSADFGPRLPTNQLNNNQNMSQSVRLDGETPSHGGITVDNLVQCQSLKKFIIKAEQAKRARLSVAQNTDSRMYVKPYDLAHAWPNLRQTFRDC